MDVKPYFKGHNLVSVHSKSIILGQMTNLNMVFHVVVLVYRFVKIWNSPQCPAEFRNGQWSNFHLKKINVRKFSREPDLRVCGYCAYDLFLWSRSLWNISKDARKLRVGCLQFYVGINEN